MSKVTGTETGAFASKPITPNKNVGNGVSVALTGTWTGTVSVQQIVADVVSTVGTYTANTNIIVDGGDDVAVLVSGTVSTGTLVYALQG